nr:MAG TPA: hypothetical protein [Caudoviricetes sp.]
MTNFGSETSIFYRKNTQKCHTNNSNSRCF